VVFFLARAQGHFGDDVAVGGVMSLRAGLSAADISCAASLCMGGQQCMVGRGGWELLKYVRPWSRARQ
jgi:hypothetical protein